jgi:NAD(P)-dependent dehydrogenase (short-subunit alcohol dehydrogenase family)
MDLQDAVAVVTGAGSGIGRAVAHSFARRGGRVVVTDLDADRAATVAGELGPPAIAQRCDVTDIADLEAVRDLAIDRFGGVDVVVNNVGVLAVGDVLDIPLDAWQRVVDINLLSVVRSNLVFLPLLVEQGSGHVVNTASTAGLLPYGYDRLPYTATKHAIVGLSEALRLRLRDDGVGVSCVCPAGVFTNILEQITFFGEPKPPRAPSFGIVDPDVVGELVADAVTDDRFLVLTAPEVEDELREHGADLDAYLARIAADAAADQPESAVDLSDDRSDPPPLRRGDDG